MNLKYTPLEKIHVPRPVNRIAWIVEQVRGKAVLDLGGYDETATNKIDTPYWLHGRMARTAQSVTGIDHSERLPADGLSTAPNCRIFRGDIYDAAAAVKDHPVDIVVAGELIEHLPDTLGFLRRLKAAGSFAGKILILTTPNACAFHNVLLGALGCESNHPDHLQIYSYKTLNTLCLRAGFRSWQILPYHALFTEMILRSSGMRRICAAFAEKILHLIETIFPMLSGGWIVRIEI